MALFLHRPLNGHIGELGLWKIEESEEWFLNRLALHPDEQIQLDGIKGRRRIEWLSVRYLVHKMSGRTERGIFLKDQFGKPFLQFSNWQISISHSRLFAAAIASPLPVGIDIQKIVGKIDRILHKFMRPAEQASLDTQHHLAHAHVYWGAKEALYKVYGRKELNFCEHILVDPFPFSGKSGQFTGRVQKNGIEIRCTLRYELLAEDYVLVYCIAPED